MRISGGEARGVRLKVPAGSRPAAERTRQAVFGSLGDLVDGARVLDLYCGSGAYGLEALSRGAFRAVFVDRDARALALARRNAEAAGLGDRARFVRRDALAFIRSGPRPGADGFDIVFCDPPYADDEALPRILRALQWAPEGGVVVCELRRSPSSAPEAGGFTLEADKRYGDTRVLIYRRGDVNA